MAVDRTDTRTGTATVGDHDSNRDPITGAPGSHPTGVGIGAAAGGATGVGAAIAVGAATGSIAGPIGTAIGIITGAVVGGYIGKGVGEKVDPTEDEAYWRDEHKSRPYYKDTYDYDTDLAPAYRYGSTIGLHADNDYDRPVGVTSTTGSTSSALGDKAHSAGHAVGEAYRNVKEKVKDALTPDNDVAKTSAGFTSPGRGLSYDTHENDIRAGWDQVRGKSSLDYDEARDAIRDAYDRRLKLRQEQDVSR